MNRNQRKERYEYIDAGPCHLSCLFRREVSGGYRVTCLDMPGMVAFGSTLDDARDNAREELLACLAGSAVLDELRSEWQANADR